MKLIQTCRQSNYHVQFIVFVFVSAGPPGKRGRRGRNGEPGTYTCVWTLEHQSITLCFHSWKRTLYILWRPGWAHRSVICGQVGFRVVQDCLRTLEKADFNRENMEGRTERVLVRGCRDLKGQQRQFYQLEATSVAQLSRPTVWFSSGAQICFSQTRKMSGFCQSHCAILVIYEVFALFLCNVTQWRCWTMVKINFGSVSVTNSDFILLQFCSIHVKNLSVDGGLLVS